MSRARKRHKNATFQSNIKINPQIGHKKLKGRMSFSRFLKVVSFPLFILHRLLMYHSDRCGLNALNRKSLQIIYKRTLELENPVD